MFVVTSGYLALSHQSATAARKFFQRDRRHQDEIRNPIVSAPNAKKTCPHLFVQLSVIHQLRHRSLLLGDPELPPVAERAFFLWNNDHIENLIKQNYKTILPIVLPALEQNARNHWNQAVRSLTLNVCKIFSDTDHAFYEECMTKFREDEAQEEDMKSKREAKWKRLEEMGGMKVATNEAVLISPSKASRAQLE